MTPQEQEASQARSLDLIDRQRKLIAKKLAEIERLKRLCIRAVEALSYQSKFINDHCCDGYPECGKLIVELRKAAE
jgi:hypothetical protein